MYSCGHVSCNMRSSYKSMSKALYGPTAVLPVMMIGVMMMMMMSLGVSAQPPVNDDDEAYRQSGTFEDSVKEIRADINRTSDETARDVQQLTEVKKNLLGSRQQPRKFGAFDSSSLCECKIHSHLICGQSRVTKISDCGFWGLPEPVMFSPFLLLSLFGFRSCYD